MKVIAKFNFLCNKKSPLKTLKLVFISASQENIVNFYANIYEQIKFSQSYHFYNTLIEVHNNFRYNFENTPLTANIEYDRGFS